jgi:hypothetical protein
LENCGEARKSLEFEFILEIPIQAIAGIQRENPIYEHTLDAFT